MTTTTNPSAPSAGQVPERAMAMALRLAHAENALRALTSGQVDAIIDPDGQTYLLRPAQESMRRNEQRLQAIIEGAADVITVVDRGGAILSQSRAAQPVLGYAPGELVGKRVFDLIHQDDLPLFYTAYFNVIEAFQEHATVRFRHRDRHGFDRLVEATIGQLRGFAPASVVISVRPVASSLAALSESERASAIDPSL